MIRSTSEPRLQDLTTKVTSTVRGMMARLPGVLGKASTLPGNDTITGEFLKSSFMLKRSQNKKWYTKENYKNRWFLLYPNALTYYDGTTETGWLREKGRIWLNEISVVAAVADDALGNGMMNAFQIEYVQDGENHTLYVIANYREERDEWVEVLQKACHGVGVRFSRLYHPGVWQQKGGQYTCCHRISRFTKGCEIFHSKHARYDELENMRLDSTGSLDTHSTGSVDSQGSVKCIALYNYDKTESSDLTLRKGIEYSVLDDQYHHWWKVRSPQGEIGYIPANYVKVLTKDGLEHYGWYFPDITRHQCEKLLTENHWDGCFLLRHSSKQGFYTLSVFSIDSEAPSGVVRHYQVNQDPSGQFFFAEKFRFGSIPDLITYHKYNLVGLTTRLRGPPRKDEDPMPGVEPFCREGKWHIERSQLTIKETVGSGEFGAVYKGLWQGRTTVAIKSMKQDAMSKDDFLLEAETMTQLQHPHLVTLYGVCVIPDAIYIVAEYMENGSLLNYLTTWRDRLHKSLHLLLDMCVQVCRGMVYLERQGFVHRDLAARNCLVGKHNIIKVGDFGLARFVSDNIYTSNVRSKIPIRWASPEVLNKCQYSLKSDVWSYGVLMWEIYSCGSPPYHRLKKNVEVYNHVVNNGARLDRPSSCPRNIYELMSSCWANDIEDRPKFSELLRSLEAHHKQ